MKKGLVLAGGGAKGAYHIGVLMALQKCQIEVDIITGTSIGALIGCMAAQQRTDEVIALWKRLKVEDVIEEGVSLNINIEEMFERKQEVLRFFKQTLKEKRVNIDPLKKIIDQGLDFDRLINSDIDFGLVTYKISKNEAVMITKKEMNKENCRNYLLASASCFPAFPVCSFDNEEYIDGGYVDNCPVELALSMGAQELIVVELNTKPQHPEFLGRPNILTIVPHEDLGSFLDFDRDVLDYRIQLGYWDTMKALHQLEGVRCTFALNSIGSEYIQRYYKALLIWEMELNRGKVKKTMNPFSAQPISSFLKTYSSKMMLSVEEYGSAALDLLVMILMDKQDVVLDGNQCILACLSYYKEHIHELTEIIQEITQMKLPAIKKLIDRFSEKELICIITKLILDTQAKNALLLIMGIFPKEFSAALMLACVIEENR